MLKIKLFPTEEIELIKKDGSVYKTKIRALNRDEFLKVQELTTEIQSYQTELEKIQKKGLTSDEDKKRFNEIQKQVAEINEKFFDIIFTAGFDNDKEAIELVKNCPLVVQTQIQTEIMKLSGLSEEEAKN